MCRCVKKMKKIICIIFGHNFKVFAKPKEEWGKGIRWLHCKRCKRDYVINDDVRVILPMDFALLDAHKWEPIKYS